MKKLLIALTLLALAPRLATAQEAKTAVGATRVTYSRATPKGLRAFVPRGGKSRFWGATKLKYNGQQVWVHVYDMVNVRFTRYEEANEVEQKSGLDLFVFAGSKRLRRIATHHFTYDRFGNYESGADREPIGVQTFWLNAKTKETPIVQIEINNPQSLYGTNTKFVFFVFSQNFHKAIVENNQWGIGSASSGGWSTTFGVDENGLTTLFYNEFNSSGTTKTTFKWVNNKFKPFEKKFKELTEGAEFKTVPLKRVP
ncbi:MAG TPA: hypothetical protein VF627_00490 [Abditibacterium sp.]|jgi:hypothetical protein